MTHIVRIALVVTGVSLKRGDEIRDKVQGVAAGEVFRIFLEEFLAN